MPISKLDLKHYLFYTLGTSAFIAGSFSNGSGYRLLALCFLLSIFVLSDSIGKHREESSANYFKKVDILMLISGGLFFGLSLASPSPSNAWVNGAELLVISLSYFGWRYRSDIAEPKNIAVFIGFLFLSSFIYLVLGFTQVVIDFLLQHQLVRPFGPGLDDPNGFAALLYTLGFTGIALLFLIPKLVSARLAKVLSYFIYTVLGLIAILFLSTQSKGALLTVCFGAAILFWTLSLSLSTKAKKLFMLAMCLLIGSGTFIAKDRISALANVSDKSSSSRISLMKSTVEMIGDLKNPIIGAGINQWNLTYAQYRKNEDNDSSGWVAHNDYLQLAFEGGILGELALLIPLGLSLFSLYRIRQKLAKNPNEKHWLPFVSLNGAVLCLSIHAFFNFIYFYVHLSLIVGTYLGIIFNALAKDSHEELLVRPKTNYYFGILVPIYLVTFWFVMGNALALTAHKAYFKPLSFEGKRLAFLGSEPMLSYLNKTFPWNPTWKYLQANDADDLVADDKLSKEERLKNFKLSCDLMKDIIKDNPNMVAYYNALVTSMLFQLPSFEGNEKDKVISEAQYFAEKGLEVDPRFAKLRLKLASIYTMQNKHKEALATLEKGVKISIIDEDTYRFEAAITKLKLDNKEYFENEH